MAGDMYFQRPMGGLIEINPRLGEYLVMLAIPWWEIAWDYDRPADA